MPVVGRKQSGMEFSCAGMDAWDDRLCHGQKDNENDKLLFPPSTPLPNNAHQDTTSSQQKWVLPGQNASRVRETSTNERV
jgi:hypothetical protein